jgi:hypothetical protein
MGSKSSKTSYVYTLKITDYEINKSCSTQSYDHGFTYADKKTVLSRYTLFSKVKFISHVKLENYQLPSNIKYAYLAYDNITNNFAIIDETNTIMCLLVYKDNSDWKYSELLGCRRSVDYFNEKLTLVKIKEHGFDRVVDYLKGVK